MQDRGFDECQLSLQTMMTTKTRSDDHRRCCSKVLAMSACFRLACGGVTLGVALLQCQILLLRWLESLIGVCACFSMAGVM